MSNKVRCCYKCKKRTETCHCTCEDYKAEKPVYNFKEDVYIRYMSEKAAKKAHIESRKTKRR